jgi:hypothetical protein
MRERGKKAIKKTGDHNWDMERMQFEKDNGNVSNESDYVNMKTKPDDVQMAMGNNKPEELTNTTNIAMPYNRGQKTIEEKKE